MKKNVSQILPKEQKEIIKRALELQYKAIDGNGLKGDEVEYMKHDIRSLIAFLEYDVSVTLSKDMMDKFAFIHGVDFPEYTDVEAKYPIEVESEWVTVIVGDFSFNDDKEHQRSAYVNSIVSIQKHLRSQVDDYIDDVEADGYGYIVVEEYDGRIEFDTEVVEVKDERLFQTVDVCGSYTVTNTFDEVSTEGGYDDHYINKIDGLGVAETLEVHKEEVYLIRIK